MNPQDILVKAIQSLGSRIGNQPIVPLIPQTTLQNLFTRPPSGLDPGSLYGAYQQNPREAMTSAVMGMATPSEAKAYEVKPPPGSFVEGWKGIPLQESIKKINLDMTPEKLNIIQKILSGLTK